MSEQRSEHSDQASQFVLENQGDETKLVIEGDIKVGRDPACHLVLTCNKGSRLHAEVLLSDGSLWVEDRNSTNGTYVNKERISERTRLEDGDILQFGDSRFRVIASGAQDSEDDEMGTVLANPESLRRMLEDEGISPAGVADDSPPDATVGPDDEIGKDSSDHQVPEQSPSAREAPVSADQPKPQPEKPQPENLQPENVGDDGHHDEAPDPASPDLASDNPSIPRSWADADQLEKASHTEVFARNKSFGGDSESGALHPLEAIADARLKTAPDMAVLVGLRDPIRGQLFELDHKGDTRKWEMGRGQGADIDIDHESVSGRHAQLIHENGRWKVVNMMSVNGTFLNDRKILSAYLSARDVIRMGAVELVFDARTENSQPDAQEKPQSGGLSSALHSIGNLWSRLISRFRH